MSILPLAYLFVRTTRIYWHAFIAHSKGSPVRLRLSSRKGFFANFFATRADALLAEVYERLVKTRAQLEVVCDAHYVPCLGFSETRYVR
jgi:hypothetical protein